MPSQYHPRAYVMTGASEGPTKTSFDPTLKKQRAQTGQAGRSRKILIKNLREKELMKNLQVTSMVSTEVRASPTEQASRHDQHNRKSTQRKQTSSTHTKSLHQMSSSAHNDHIGSAMCGAGKQSQDSVKFSIIRPLQQREPLLSNSKPRQIRIYSVFKSLSASKE